MTNSATVFPLSPVAPTSPSEGKSPWTLQTLFRAYRGRILLTYALFNLENILRLLQPLVLGLAINDLLLGSYLGLALFVAQHLGHLAVGTLRRMYDTRTFTGIYTDLASGLVIRQRDRQVAVSAVAARSTLSRVFVEFFERDVPALVRALYSVIGALVLLAWYDWLLVPLCVVLLAPAYMLNKLYGRKTFLCNRRLHDELEREVAVIHQGKPAEIRDHYQRVAGWRVKLSDWEALNFGLMELFILGLMVAALARSCHLGAAPGDIFAIFRYVLMFIMGLDSVPILVQQMGRLRDVGRRLRDEDSRGDILSHSPLLPPPVQFPS